MTCTTSHHQEEEAVGEASEVDESVTNKKTGSSSPKCKWKNTEEKALKVTHTVEESV